MIAYYLTIKSFLTLIRSGGETGSAKLGCWLAFSAGAVIGQSER